VLVYFVESELEVFLLFENKELIFFTDQFLIVIENNSQQEIHEQVQPHHNIHHVEKERIIALIVVLITDLRVIR